MHTQNNNDNEKQGYDGSQLGFLLSQYFSGNKFWSPARVEILMQGYAAQFHYGYDEKQAREHISSTRKVQVHVWGQQDGIFEIETVPENP